jgi:hypothetical protein
MKNFRKDLACNITLIGVLLCLAVHLLVITLNLFGAISISLPTYFNYIFAYFFVAVSLALYVVGFVLSAKLGASFPKWLRILFYIAFFIFTNTYYLTGLYTNLVALVFMFMYLSFCFSIVSLSVFYNAQKDDKNRLKSSRKFIVSSTFMFSLGFEFVFLLVVQAIKAFAFPDGTTSTLLVFVVEAFSMLLVSIIVSVLFNASLKRSKKFINACLVKFNAKPQQKQVETEKQKI